jgi:hypothetical protein
MMLGGSSYELDAAPNAQTYIIFLFCVIWAASVRRHMSLPQSAFILLNQKKSPKMLFLQGKSLKRNHQCTLG